MKTKKVKWGKIILTAILFLFGVACIFPFVFMLSSSFKPLNEIFVYPIKLIPENFILTNYIEVFSEKYDFVQSSFQSM